MRFSERYGYTPARSVLQTNDIDAGLRSRLWNVVCDWIFPNAPKSRDAALGMPFHLHGEDYDLFVHLWHDYFKLPTDNIASSYFAAMAQLRKYFFEAQWYSVYDLIEFLANSVPNPKVRQAFIDDVNNVLKEELAGYRFVSGRIVQITSDEEIASIEEALALPDALRAVTAHLRQALALMADKRALDYRNSIKESISAIESLSKILSGLPAATLGPALNAVEKQAKLHPSLKEAFQKLYGYTSDAQGIRHALMDEPTLDIEDAKFMLVSCSAFVNYMLLKAQKAGVKI
jgi:hypothetical protein